MKLISHRGNMCGRKPKLENTVQYILDALNEGFDVEVDVWYQDGKWWLGHDEPTTHIPASFLEMSGLWIHAKNSLAAIQLAQAPWNSFWHENDKLAITTKRFIWSCERIEGPSSVWMLTESDWEKHHMSFLFWGGPHGVYGVCTDNVALLKAVGG